ncbi:hypothetical protein CAPTEDRAFT_220586 [Capitella teleta]|uniref:E2 ubiquitin-conjugating enzyme n=1 Tax=Capitella teleta TaxID=283909 RepID=R7VF96_CAPTE|nr:hypothetical protein CAPTEDRAFT_220586 [Capitella teleta]|eukprot:ELU14345.1 hypothetical protein CAPTEDRAFT_220586 [Capitella teleta]
MATSEASELPKEFLSSKLSACSVCQGYYGPNFGWPVCNTCHLFLFAADINTLSHHAQFAEKTDSGDSGTEEPNEETDFYMKPQTKASERTMVPTTAVRGDRLAERITNLSCPREYQSEKLDDGLIDSLPPEVLLNVFRFLDDISLWSAGKVCNRWRQLLEAETSDDCWRRFIQLRWPLFHPVYKVECWRTVFSRLLESAPCLFCLESMMLQSHQAVEENSWRHRRLRIELKTLRADPPEGIQAIPLDRQRCHWQACITGPQGSPYQGGLFYLYVQIPNNYPMRPPVVRFITKIFHPNISWHGDVGLDSIQHNWSLALTLSKVLISIQSLLTDPYCHVCMLPAAATLFTKQRPLFDQIARIWTWKYAMHDYIKPSKLSLINVL